MVDNWGGLCRSNYVVVKDQAAYESFLSNYDLAITSPDSLGRVAWVSNEIAGDIPRMLDADGLTINGTSILDDIHNHLQDGEILIVQQVGYETGGASLYGAAVAISSTGDQVVIELEQITALAKAQLFNINPINPCRDPT